MQNKKLVAIIEKACEEEALTCTGKDKLVLVAKSGMAISIPNFFQMESAQDFSNQVQQFSDEAAYVNKLNEGVFELEVYRFSAADIKSLPSGSTHGTEQEQFYSKVHRIFDYIRCEDSVKAGLESAALVAKTKIIGSLKSYCEQQSNVQFIDYMEFFSIAKQLTKKAMDMSRHKLLFHGDMHANNILITDKGKVVVYDPGNTRNILVSKSRDEITQQYIKTRLFTRDIAPQHKIGFFELEFIRNNRRTSQAYDVYGLLHNLWYLAQAFLIPHKIHLPEPFKSLLYSVKDDYQTAVKRFVEYYNIFSHPFTFLKKYREALSHIYTFCNEYPQKIEKLDHSFMEHSIFAYGQPQELREIELKAMSNSSYYT